MARNFISRLVGLVFVLAISLQIQADDSPVAKPKAKRSLVTVTATKAKRSSPRKVRLEFVLTIRPGVAIYANKQPPGSDENYPLLPITKIELLDKRKRVIVAKMEYPKGSLVKRDFGDFRVYSGQLKVTATLRAASNVEFVRVKYAGFRYGGRYEGYS